MSDKWITTYEGQLESHPNNRDDFESVIADVIRDSRPDLKPFLTEGKKGRGWSFRTTRYSWS